MRVFLSLAVASTVLATAPSFAAAPADGVGAGIRVIPAEPTKQVAAKANRRVTARPLRCTFEVTAGPAKSQSAARGKSPAKPPLRRLVKIELPKAHPRQLAIVSPDGTWHYLHDGLEFHQLGKNFAAASGLELDITKVKSQRNLKAKKVQVFQKSGTYTFYFADNLETEMANTFALSCKLPINLN